MWSTLTKQFNWEVTTAVQHMQHWQTCCAHNRERELEREWEYPSYFLLLLYVRSSQWTLVLCCFPPLTVARHMHKHSSAHSSSPFLLLDLLSPHFLLSPSPSLSLSFFSLSRIPLSPGQLWWELKGMCSKGQTAEPGSAAYKRSNADGDTGAPKPRTYTKTERGELINSPSGQSLNPSPANHAIILLSLSLSCALSLSLSTDSLSHCISL